MHCPGKAGEAGTVDTGEEPLGLGQGGGALLGLADPVAQFLQEMKSLFVLPLDLVQALQKFLNDRRLFVMAAQNPGQMFHLPFPRAVAFGSPRQLDFFPQFRRRRYLGPSRLRQFDELGCDRLHRLGRAFFRRTARAAPLGDFVFFFVRHQNSFRLSSSRVTGPSLIRCTCISA
jgi:hypothetical protein